MFITRIICLIMNSTSAAFRRQVSSSVQTRLDGMFRTQPQTELTNKTASQYTLYNYIHTYIKTYKHTNTYVRINTNTYTYVYT